MRVDTHENITTSASMAKARAVQSERLRVYGIERAKHKLKNRSSKHERAMRMMRPIVVSWSNDMVNRYASMGDIDAIYEQQRRERKRLKRDGML